MIRGGDRRALEREAASVVIRNQYASASFLQTRLRVGQSTAALLLLVLEERAIVGPPALGVSREVLVRAERRREVLDAEWPPDPP